MLGLCKRDQCSIPFRLCTCVDVHIKKRGSNPTEIDDISLVLVPFYPERLNEIERREVRTEKRSISVELHNLQWKNS